MRRVVVTPTFAAGLGVVVAAVLALQMRTAFNYAAPNDAPCRTNSCGVPYHAGGEPASGAGDRISTSVPSATRSGAGSSPPAKRQPAGGNHGRPPSAGPGLGYSTVHKGQWGFDGTIVITFRPGAAPRHWRLWFGYPSARIFRVWAAGRSLPHGMHSAAVSSGDWTGQAPARLITVSIGVTGPPGPPHQCYFNGQVCHIIQR